MTRNHGGRASLAIAQRNPKRAAASGWVGSALEYYDFALYSQAAALVFPTIFFPSGNGAVALVASLATYAVGYVVRPIGAIILGAWGDRHGRKKVLVAAMMTMGISTMAVGLLPTFGQVGLLSPILLVALRLIQGFAVAGELGGASAMIVEHAPDEKRGFFASFSLQGTQFGSILATFALIPFSALLDRDSFVAWGWRVPFLLSALVIIAGMIIRSKVTEPPVFVSDMREGAAKRRFPLSDLLRHQTGTLLACIVMTLTNVIGMTTLVYGVSYATADGYGVGLSSTTMLWVTLVANVIAVITIPIFGALSDRIGRRIFMIVGGVVGGALSYFYLLAIANRNVVMMFVMIIIVQGVFYQMWNATFATFYQEQFPMRYRVTGFAVAQNMGLMIASFIPSIFAAVAPPGSTQVPLTIGCTTLGIAALGAIAAAFTKETKGASPSDLEEAH